MQDESDAIPTNLRTIRVLEIVAAAERPVTPTEVNATLRLPKATVHRLCQTLLDEGFLVRDGAQGGLRPGRRLRAMAAGALHASRFHVQRRQILMRVAEEVGETVNYVVPVDEGMTYRDRVETGWALRIQLPVGSHVPFHCTASGKAFLATLPEEERRRMVAALRLEALTPRTITEPGRFLAELDRVARQGHAVDNEEFMDGMVAVAVPVRDPAGRYIASLAFHAPRQRLTMEAALTKRDVLVRAAAALGESVA